MKSFLDLARVFVEAGVLAPSDVHAVALTAPRFGEADAMRMLGLAFAVRAPRVGHAGVDLGAIAAIVEDDRPTDADASDRSLALPWPEPSRWMAATLESPMVGAPEEADRPFVRQALAERTLLLTRRTYREQERVARAMLERASRAVPHADAVRDLDARVAALLPGDAEGEIAQALRLAATRCLAIVVGGPGTGKTFSITRLLATIVAGDRGGRPWVVKLAAPTGKAAVRMREAIREATAPDADPALAVDDRVRAALRDLDASTLHRLLGMRPDGSARHGPHAPLPADVIVVDEVSMVDLALMRRVVEAAHPDARLVLLGDRDQLASVQAGCVLADVAGAADGGSPLVASIRTLTRSHRFASAPDIALVAACLQSYRTAMDGVPAEEDARLACAVDVLAGRAHAPGESDRGRIEHLGEPLAAGAGSGARPSDEQLRRLAEPYLEGYVAILAEARLVSGAFSPASHDASFRRRALDALGAYRVLAVHRRGALGVTGLDRALGERIRERLGGAEAHSHWIGRPILVTENAYDVGLMNGDVGLVLPAEHGPVAVFPHERADDVRTVALSRLPPHEGALAMTVHKAQGSQFDRVALVLAGRRSPIQTRELVYTGVTRAKSRLAWLGGESELREALATRVERASGLDPLLR